MESVIIKSGEEQVAPSRMELVFKLSNIFNRTTSVYGGKSLVGLLKTMKDKLDLFSSDKDFTGMKNDW
jgi:hypothetical protein